MSPQSGQTNGKGANDGSANGFTVEPLPGATFGGLVRFADGDAAAAVAAAEADPDYLPRTLYDALGFLLLPGMQGLSDDPSLLVRLSQLFGPEVEDYRQTLTSKAAVHESVPQIFMVSNLPPTKRQPPPKPNPPRTADGGLPVQFPHRRGWHTDQCYRRPPPDMSLFYAVIPAPKGQGQTLYANGIAAYEALPADLKEQADKHDGIHVRPRSGRSEQSVLAGETPAPLGPNEQPQRQPLVRVHPVTGQRALFMCEAGQMDWVTGPIHGMEPGPDGDGAKLLYALMSHYTQPQFTYAHEWSEGDLVIYDNRSLIHAATWFDADAHRRMMWRTTVWGNPGEAYAGEKQSWVDEARAS